MDFDHKHKIKRKKSYRKENILNNNIYKNSKTNKIIL